MVAEKEAGEQLNAEEAIVAPFPRLAIGLCDRKNLELTVACFVGAIGFGSIKALCLYGTSLRERLTTPELQN